MADPSRQFEPWEERLAAADPTLRVHLVGIGGAGLAPIAAVLHQSGLQVSGSDPQSNKRTEHLAREGIAIYSGQRAENITGLPPERRPDVVLLSSAIAPDNPERLAAEALGLPVVKRRRFLSPLLARRKVIAVAGTHGKSTTTAMIAQMLHGADIDAGYIIGSDLAGFGNAHAGSNPYFVIEADEYDHMFLGLSPTIAVITNVEWDHPDCYPTAENFRRAFQDFVARVREVVVACGDDPGARSLRDNQTLHPLWIAYGLAESVDVRAVDVHAQAGGGVSATIRRGDESLGRLVLGVPGVHNLRNGLAALLVGRCCGVSTAAALASLARYAGIARRFERKGEAAGVTVIDDYAHHPTEVAATLDAARKRYPRQRIWAVFQPHTYSRTALFLGEMANSFAQADRVVVTDIYGARETDSRQISAATLVAASNHPHISHIGGLEAVADHIARQVRPGDIVITLGAGTSYRIGELVLAQLGSQRAEI